MKKQLNYQLRLNFSIEDKTDTRKIGTKILELLQNKGILKPYTHFGEKFSSNLVFTNIPNFKTSSKFTFRDHRTDAYSSNELSVSLSYNKIALCFTWSNESYKEVGDLIQFSQNLLKIIDTKYGNKLWGTFPSLVTYKHCPQIRPLRYHRWINGTRIWEAYDLRVLGTGTDLNKMELPKMAKKKIVGNYLFINWVDGFNSEHCNGILERLQFMAKTFQWPLANSINEYGDRFKAQMEVRKYYNLQENSEHIETVIDLYKRHETAIKEHNNCIIVANRKVALLFEEFINDKTLNQVVYFDEPADGYYDPYMNQYKWANPIQKKPLELKFSINKKIDKPFVCCEAVKELIKTIDLPYIKSDYLDKYPGLRKLYVPIKKQEKWISYNEKAKTIIEKLKPKEIQQAIGVAGLMGELEVVKHLFNRKADLNSISYLNIPPLILAIMGRNQSVVDWMLKNGADITIKTEHNETVLHKIMGESDYIKIFKLYNVKGGMRRQFETVDTISVEKNRLNIFDLLLKNGAKQIIDNQNSQGYTPFDQAISNEDKQLSKELVKSGANISIRNGEAHTGTELLAIRGEITTLKEIMLLNVNY